MRKRKTKNMFFKNNSAIMYMQTKKTKVRIISIKQKSYTCILWTLKNNNSSYISTMKTSSADIMQIKHKRKTIFQLNKNDLY